jgi:hypothetical protein
VREGGGRHRRAERKEKRRGKERRGKRREERREEKRERERREEKRRERGREREREREREIERERERERGIQKNRWHGGVKKVFTVPRALDNSSDTCICVSISLARIIFTFFRSLEGVLFFPPLVASMSAASEVSARPVPDVLLVHKQQCLILHLLSVCRLEEFSA